MVLFKTGCIVIKNGNYIVLDIDSTKPYAEIVKIPCPSKRIIFFHVNEIKKIRYIWIYLIDCLAKYIRIT